LAREDVLWATPPAESVPHSARRPSRKGDGPPPLPTATGGMASLAPPVESIRNWKPGARGSMGGTDAMRVPSNSGRRLASGVCGAARWCVPLPHRRGRLSLTPESLSGLRRRDVIPYAQTTFARYVCCDAVIRPPRTRRLKKLGGHRSSGIVGSSYGGENSRPS
jgi:hypothetical protein